MITPNLASRPFLNTRPVWLLTVAATAIALLLVILNVRMFMVADRALDDETAKRDRLEQRIAEIEERLRTDVTTLERVPWRSLRGRVEAANLVLREHAFSWLQMLDDIERIMPYDVRLTRISPTVGSDGVSLSFEVVARSREAMLQLLDNLIADPRFDDPAPRSEGTPEETGTGVYTLSLTVLYRLPEEVS